MRKTDILNSTEQERLLLLIQNLADLQRVVCNQISFRNKDKKDLHEKIAELNLTLCLMESAKDVDLSEANKIVSNSLKTIFEIPVDIEERRVSHLTLIKQNVS